MFNPEKDDYPQNDMGKPEFASVILHLDPALQTEDDTVVSKLVLSTEDVITSLTKVAAHFGEPALLSNPANANLLMAAGRSDNPTFVYVTPRQGTTLILMGTGTWYDLVSHPDFGDGSTLLATQKIEEVAARQQEMVQQFSGGFSKLLFLDFTVGERPNEDDADAASLRDTAQFEDVSEQPERTSERSE